MRRWWPAAAIGGLMLVSYSFGLWDDLTLQNVAVNHERLSAYVTAHPVLAILLYSALYLLVVALSVPGAALLTVAGGLLFGWLVGAIVTIIAATAGAVLVFLAARTSFRDVFMRQAGGLVTKVQEGFAADAFYYLLFLRLVPIFPFWLVNIAAALSPVKLPTFVGATVIGIIPGTIAITVAGVGLKSVIAAQDQSYQACVAQGRGDTCHFDLSLAAILTPQIIIALLLLGVSALIPIGLKYWKAHHDI